MCTAVLAAMHAPVVFRCGRRARATTVFDGARAKSGCRLLHQLLADYTTCPNAAVRVCCQRGLPKRNESCVIEHVRASIFYIALNALWTTPKGRKWRNLKRR